MSFQVACSISAVSRIHEAEGKFKGTYHHIVPQVLTSSSADLSLPLPEYSYYLLYPKRPEFVVVLSERNKDKCPTLHVPPAGAASHAGEDRGAREFPPPEPLTNGG